MTGRVAKEETTLEGFLQITIWKGEEGLAFENVSN
jgi:hypothetical protein